MFGKRFATRIWMASVGLCAVVMVFGCSSNGDEPPKTYSISGSVSGDVTAGVTLTLTGAKTGTDTSDASGNYSFSGLEAGSYTITPSLQGYTFSPAEKVVNISNVSVQGADFIASRLTFHIAGSITGDLITGVVLNLSGADTATTTSDANGDYSFDELDEGSYTVTPVLAGYTFTPASANVSLSGVDQNDVDFVAKEILYTIQGSVSGDVQAGVLITLAGDDSATTTTDASGNYTFADVDKGSYSLTPSKTDYVFAPASLVVVVASGDVIDQDFVATQHSGQTYSISGQVRLNNQGHPGVRLDLSGDGTGSVVSDSSGNYSFTGLLAGSYSVTPVMGSYGFEPSDQTVVVDADNVNVIQIDFNVITYWISGCVRTQEWQPVQGVSMTLDPAIVPAVVTDQQGCYTIDGVPSGTYTLIPSLSSASTLFDPVELELTITDQGLSEQNFSVSMAMTVSGSVKYSGAKTGRVYVRLDRMDGRESQHGTSVAASSFPVDFEIRGVSPGSYRVSAYLDTLGTGYQHVVSPSGMSGTFMVSNQDKDVGEINLSDPQIPNPQPPDGLMLVPFDQGVFVMWGAPRDENDNPAAEYFNLYWSSDAQVGPEHTTGGSSLEDIPLGHDFNGATITGLTNGQQLYFAVNTELGGQTSTDLVAPQPVTVGTSAGGHTVSGQITFSGFTPTGNVWAAAVTGGDDGPETIFVNLLPVTGNTMNYSIPGVQDGDYAIYTLVDMDGDGYMGPGDVMPGDQGAGMVSVSGSDEEVDVTVEAQNIESLVATDHSRDSSDQQDWYSVSLRVVEGFKLPVAAVITKADGMIPPRDLARAEWGFEAWTQLGSTRPAIGDEIELALTFSDGTTQDLTLAVTRVLDSFAQPVSPVGSNTGDLQPIFSWNAPAQPPTSYLYRINIWQDNGPGIWWSDDISSANTTATFNFDQQASVSSLSQGGTYTWEVVVEDDLHNTCRRQAQFTP